MKRLILLLIIITSCSSIIEEDQDCNCRVKTEKITLVNNGGVLSTVISTSYKDYNYNECTLNGKIILQSNKEVRTVVCE